MSFPRYSDARAHRQTPLLSMGNFFLVPKTWVLSNNIRDQYRDAQPR
jgi:hypothetical protein